VVTIPLTLLAVVIGLAGSLTILLDRHGRPPAHALGRGFLAVGAGGLLGFAVVVAAAATDRLRSFGLIHYLYLFGTISVPMLGAAGVFHLWSGRTHGRSSVLPWFAVGALLLPAPVGFYATHIEPNWLRVDHLEVALAADRAGEHPVTIGVLADLQTNDVGPHEREAVDELMAAAPDVILIPGDLFHGNDREYARELDAMRELLGRLHAPHGVFMVQGDAETEPWLSKMLEGTDISMLDDDVVDLTVEDRRLRIGGHTLQPGHAGADAVREELLATPDPEVVTVLVAHRPDTVMHLPDRSRVDLTVAGHTHGGQIVVPGIGPLVTLSEVPRDIARGGLHGYRGNQIYVSPGVGIERGDAPQVRLFNRPAVAILTLR
jgi:predicted MPP superfamily phosphohydrolase